MAGSVIISASLLVCFVFLSAYSQSQAEYYVAPKNKALIKVVRENEVVTDCNIFADSTIIDFYTHELGVNPVSLTKKKFRKLRRECMPAEERERPRRIKAKSAKMRALAKKIRLENRKKNKDRKRKAAEKRGRKNKNRKRAKKQKKVERKKARKEKKAERQEVRSRIQRSKRALIENGFEIFFAIFPGTLWCGAGNLTGTVETDDGLGEKKALDSCCRGHDYCPLSIPGFSWKFDLFNYSPITCSDCDCDSTFSGCLSTASSSDTTAATVGDIFFNILGLDCVQMEHPWKCVEYDWTGWFCQQYERDTAAQKVWEFFADLSFIMP